LRVASRRRRPARARAPRRRARSRAARGRAASAGCRPSTCHVGKALVVEVDGVLRRQTTPTPCRAGLLEQREHRPLRGRVRGRREESEHLVHVDERPQRARPGLPAHPRLHLVEDQRDDEQPLLVGEVRDRHDRQPRRPSFARSIAPTSRGSPFLQFSNDGDARRLLRAIMSACRSLRGNAVSSGSAPSLSNGARRPGRSATRATALALAPRALDERREEDGLWRLQRVGVHAHEAEKARHDRLDLVAEVLLGRVETGRPERRATAGRRAARPRSTPA